MPTILGTPHSEKHRKNLKGMIDTEYPHPIFLQDDLTARRVKLAFAARELKRHARISDTWVWDSKILIKDRHNRIHIIKSLENLRPYIQD